MHPVLRTVLQRLALGLLTMFVTSVIIFTSLAMLPGGFAEAVLGQGATPETVAAFNHELGLDRPAYIRYGEWIADVAQGDFGYSYAGIGGSMKRKVSDLLALRLFNTFFLAALTALFAVPLALSLGVAAALKRNSWFDRIANLLTLAAVATPEFFIAYVLMFVFAIKYRWFYSLSTVSPSTPFWEHVYRAVLPSFTLMLVIVAHMMRMTRAALLNLMSSPYIEMARLKGMSKTRVILYHALPECLGTDRDGGGAEPRLSRGRCGGGRGRLRLSWGRPIDGRFRLEPRHPCGPGLRAHLCRHLRVPQSGGRHHRHRHQPPPAARPMTQAPAIRSDLRQRRSMSDRTWRMLRKAPVSAWFGLAVVLIYAICVIFAPLLAPFGQGEIVGRAYLPTGPRYLLGTDQIGRDVFSRLIYGARNTISIALATTLVSFTLGTALGVLAALLRGWFDQVLSRIVDAILAIPVLIYALMLLAIFGKGVVNLIVILAVLDATRVFRLARATALNVVVMDFVEAARLRGEKISRVVTREIIPNIMPPLITEFGLRFCYVFLTISALSFLGVGVQPPLADWGAMVAENKSLITYGRPTPLYPAAAIALLTISVNFVVDWFLDKTSGLRDEP